MSGQDLSDCKISQLLPNFDRISARFYNIAKVLQFTGEAGKAEWRYRRYRRVKYVSLLMWCWDWVQGGDPLYAAVFCLSSCHGHMFQHFEDKKLAQSNQSIPQQWSEEITERANGQYKDRLLGQLTKESQGTQLIQERTRSRRDMRDRGDRREKSNKEARPSFPPIMSKKVWIIVMVMLTMMMMLMMVIDYVRCWWC